mmetsp:Transcript_7159/g.14076  ORF Transcript_7159/g.14076 Transcript_7159/m.14076 type:complete len:282 (+) Transcript_7159:1-846(+)
MVISWSAASAPLIPSLLILSASSRSLLRSSSLAALFSIASLCINAASAKRFSAIRLAPELANLAFSASSRCFWSLSFSAEAEEARSRRRDASSCRSDSTADLDSKPFLRSVASLSSLERAPASDSTSLLSLSLSPSNLLLCSSASLSLATALSRSEISLAFSSSISCSLRRSSSLSSVFPLVDPMPICHPPSRPRSPSACLILILSRALFLSSCAILKASFAARSLCLCSSSFFALLLSSMASLLYWRFSPCKRAFVSNVLEEPHTFAYSVFTSGKALSFF